MATLTQEPQYTIPQSPNIKPLPALPTTVPSAQTQVEDAPYRDDDSDLESEASSDLEPYRDEPQTPTTTPSNPTSTPNAPRPAPLSIPTTQPPQYHPYNHQYAIHLQQQYPAPPFTPYTDTPPTPGADDVPLAHLIPSSPFYAAAQAHIQAHAHLLSEAGYPLEAPPPYALAVRQTTFHRETLIQIPRDPFAAYLGREGDEEAGMLDPEAEEARRHTLENVVAMFVVATMLLVVAGMFGWLAWGSGMIS